MRRGMGKGQGKGYKNIMGKDPKVHSESARGRKQPQRLKAGAFVKSRFTGAKGVVIREEPFAVKYKFRGKVMARQSNPKFWEKAKKKREKKNIVSTYKFEELSDGAKERVIEREKQHLIEDTYNAESVSEDMTERLKEMGINIKKESLEWDAGYSQSDDVNFIAYDIDWDKFGKERKIPKKDINFLKKLVDEEKVDIAYNKQHRGGGSYYSSLESTEYGLTTAEANRFSEISKRINQEFREIRRELLKDAYTYYEDIPSDEYVKDFLEANDYSFLADGRIV